MQRTRNDEKETDMQITVSKSISAPASKVWSTVQAFTGIDAWLPIIKKSHVDGEGVGAKRQCSFEDGSSITENLLVRDEGTMTIVYDIEDGGPMPFTGHKATIVVKDLGDGKTEVTWSSEMEPAEGAEDAVREMLGGAYNAGIDGLESLCS
jgi:uncharacterized protein YndB with AHSA1/START domain